MGRKRENQGRNREKEEVLAFQSQTLGEKNSKWRSKPLP
jgi:hypothetical protein